MLFDDTFNSSIFGLDLDQGSDPKLVQRAQRADTIQRMRVSTVTSQGREVPEYSVVLTPLPPPVAGAASSEPITIDVRARSPSWPLVRAADQTLVGKKLILLAKRYNDEGHVALHWRGEADTAKILKAINHARALDELK